MIKQFIADTYVIVILALALITVVAAWQFQESPEQAYERGYAEGWDDAYRLQYAKASDSLEWAADRYKWFRAIVDEYGAAWREKADTFFIMTALYDYELNLITTWAEAKTFLCSFDSTDAMPAVDSATKKEE